MHQSLVMHLSNLDFNEAKMTGWHWHQMDHMQIICTSLQTDNHAITSSLNFLQARCSSWRPTNSVKASNEGNRMLICWFVNTGFKPQGCGHYSINSCYIFIHSLRQSVNLNQQSTVKTAHVCVFVCISLCTTVVHNTAQDSYDNLRSYPPESHYCSKYCLLEDRGWQPK